MKKTSGPLLYIGQPQLQPVQPVMQKVVKASTDEPPVSLDEAKKEEPASEGSRLKPFREMDTTEKVIYLARRRIPVPCRFEWREGSVRGRIEKFDDAHVWVLDEKSGELVQLAIAEILHIRLAGT
ncbi:hypothetical protein [Domibacillus indicus]|uniref:hypothetical protein n=1 Tax=Domibacillus indicus TaxID=1437523 RepID=UPI000618308E|nr:hypothetical protein [Domibacillus indicus]